MFVGLALWFVWVDAVVRHRRTRTASTGGPPPAAPQRHRSLLGASITGICWLSDPCRPRQGAWQAQGLQTPSCGSNRAGRFAGAAKRAGFPTGRRRPS